MNGEDRFCQNAGCKSPLGDHTGRHFAELASKRDGTYYFVIR